MPPTDGRIRNIWRGIFPFNYVPTNHLFTFFCFSLPPILGSAATFVFHGGALWCLFAVIRNPNLLVKEPIVVRMTAALYLVVFAYAFSTFWNGHWDRVVSLSWLWAFLVFPFSYSIWRIADPAALARIVTTACSLGAIGGFLICLFQYLAYGMRGEGGAGNALVFATVTTLAVAISFAAGLRTSGSRSVFHIVAAGAGVAAIILSQSRGVWPALLVNAAVTLFVMRRRFPAISMRHVGLTLLLLVPIAALFLWEAVPRFLDLVKNYESMQGGNFQTSLGLRVLLWKTGLQAWEGARLFGLGGGSIKEITHHLVLEGASPVQYTHLHNQFLTTMVEAGLLGLVGLVAVIVVPLVYAWKTLRSDKTDIQEMGALMLFSVLITFVTCGLTNIMFKQDIMDTVFITTVIIGILLCSGYSGAADESVAPYSASR